MVKGPGTRKEMIEMQVRVGTLREALELLKSVVPAGKQPVDAVKYALIQHGKALGRSCSPLS